MKVIISPEAEADTDRLWEFIAEKNLEAAERIISELFNRIERLKHHPRIGRKVLSAPDPDRVRDLITDRYVVRYMIRTSDVYVLRIWHQREDWKDW